MFTKDGKTMYFTRNNATDKGRSKKNKNDISVLKILKATKKVDGSWGDIEVLPFNSDLFNTADPALSPDQKWLYFSSDREQSLGLSDLFRVRVYDNNVFGQVESLGPEINTQGRETFPFISSDNKLYFASDGHPGLGGLDVFVCQLNQDGSIGKVSNLGEPINSTFDDFAFYLEADNIKGFVSSNRIGGPGTDNIYSIQHRICQQIATGKVVDKADDEGLFNARVLVSRVDTNNVDTLYTDQKGYFTTALLDCEQTYVVRADLDNYELAEVVATIHKDADKNVLKLALQKEESTEQLVFDLYKQMNMTPIFFEFDRYNITPQGARELAKIVEILKEFPTMRIDVRSHTDARGNPNYNLKLSTNRAKSTRQWIVDHGIDPSRITATGFGATELLNDCNYGLLCTEEEHSENRRSEFVILSM